MLRGLEKLRGLRTSEMVRFVTRRPLVARRLGLGGLVAWWPDSPFESQKVKSRETKCKHFLGLQALARRLGARRIGGLVAWWPDS